MWILATAIQLCLQVDVLSSPQEREWQYHQEIWRAGFNQGEKAAVVLVSATPTRVLTEPRDWLSLEKSQPQRLRAAGEAGALTEGGSDPEPLEEAVLHREPRTLSLVPEKMTSPEVTWASSICWPDSSPPGAGLLVPVPAPKMKETFSDCPDGRSAIIRALGALFPVHPFKRKRKKKINTFPEGVQRYCVD